MHDKFINSITTILKIRYDFKNNSIIHINILVKKVDYLFITVAVSICKY